MSEKQVVVLFDTNRVFSLFRRFVLNQGELPQSELRKFALSEMYSFVLSSFVFIELKRISSRHDIQDFGLWFVRFLGYMNFKSIQSVPYEPNILKYVHDEFDAQIVQDAIDIHANIILTSNTKDFNIEKIRSSFGIIVTNNL